MGEGSGIANAPTGQGPRVDLISGLAQLFLAQRSPRVAVSIAWNRSRSSNLQEDGHVMSQHRIRCLSFLVLPLGLLAAFLSWPRQQETQAAERKGKFSGVRVLRQAPEELPRTITNSIGMKLVLVPAGKFTMGSPESEKDRSKNETEHEVEITRPYYMSAYLVTQEEYEKVMDKRPSWFSSTGGGQHKVKGLDTSRFPVEQVSWYDAQEFCKKLMALERKKGEAREYRLPTEAEWEYACREAGKSTTPFYFGAALSSEQANFNGYFPYGGADKGPYLGRTSKVGSYKGNKLGLYDMHGNVRQWCSDWYDKDYHANSPIKDPQGTQKGAFRVLRGGSWGGSARYCRAAFRVSSEPADRRINYGFRVVCAVPPRTR
jgi:formylglycine-generating enzyme required for sulfatase activity